jgi:hypothetical protein
MPDFGAQEYRTYIDLCRELRQAASVGLRPRPEVRQEL